MIGKSVLHYNILEKLGEGGMGVVYLAEDTKLKRQVAIKFLPKQVSPDEQERFKIEAQAAAALNHPNIATIYAIEDSNGELFIAMEYISGRELKDALTEPMPLDKVTYYATQIANGLQAAHEKRVIHRDIKSSNIMVTETGQIKIMDFGLAKIGDGKALTKDHSTVGTLAYMAPEQIQGETVDRRADIFSYGVVLFEMLTGKLPFHGEYESSMMYSILNEEPESAKEGRSDCPECLANIISKCLQKEPKDRFQNMDEILEALKDDGFKTTAKAAESAKHNLPVQLTSFIGRTKEIETVRKLLIDSRLVTLTGAGGCGKTRLSQQVGRLELDRFNDGVFVVLLASQTDSNRVPDTIAAALQIKEQANSPLLETLISNIKEKQMLLILDNCEHLISACSEISEHLLKSAPQLSILATSREALNIAGEKSWNVPSLSLPTQKEIKVESLSQFESIQLFVERAQSYLPDFVLNQQNANDVLNICVRLDGIPLAIELAAARIKVFNTQTILQRLDDRFHLLTGGSRTAIERHKTLRATIDWSYDLLSDKEKCLFNRLAVFVGGCDITAIESVCGFAPLETFEIADFITSLIDKSLVVTETTKDGNYRYQLLETLRHYGKERLVEEGEADILRDRHYDYFLNVAEEAFDNRLNNEDTVADGLERDHENLIAAIEWMQTKPEKQLQLAGVLGWFWAFHGHLSFGIGLLKPLIGHVKENTSGARTLSGLGFLNFYSYQYDEAEPYCLKAIEIWKATGNVKETCATQLELAIFDIQGGKYEKGKAILEEAIENSKIVNDSRLLFKAEVFYAVSLAFMKQIDKAEPIFERNLPLAIEMNSGYTLTAIRHVYADCAVYKEDYTEAIYRYMNALKLAVEFNNPVQALNEALCLSMAFAGYGHQSKAVKLYEAGLNELKKLGVDVTVAGYPEIIQISWSRTIKVAKQKLGQEQCEQIKNEAEKMDFDGIVEYALDIDKD